MALIHKAGLLTTRNGKVLLCRKHHTTSALILPGGKFLPGEASRDCLRRELREELGTSIAHSTLQRLGKYEHLAAHDDPEQQRCVRIELYSGELEGEPHACSEIAELVWFGASDDWAKLAPSLREAIFPDLITRGLLAWHPVI